MPGRPSRLASAGAPPRVAERALQLTALSSLAALLLITVVVLQEGAPLLLRVGPRALLLGSTWEPLGGHFGLLPMIAGTIAVAGGALCFGLPLGLSCALVLAELSPRRLRAVLRPAIELLAGMPSVVYGFLGVVLVVPWIRAHLGGPGWSVLAASVVLGLMIVPTVIGVSVDAMEAVPESLREAATALGATRFQAVHRVVLPAARSGISAAVLLGIARAAGETMVVLMVMGNAVVSPRSPLDPARTLTAHIALEMGGASGDHARALFVAGTLLLLLSLALALLVRAGRSPSALGRRPARPAAGIEGRGARPGPVQGLLP